MPSSFNLQTPTHPDLERRFADHALERSLNKSRLISELLVAYFELGERLGRMPVFPFRLEEIPPTQAPKK